jgi:Zn-dependent protease
MLHLGSIRGTSIDIDPSFFILIVFFVAMNYNPSIGIHYALLWIPILFLSVLVHELAHAAMIGLLGFGSSHIILGGMGGVTMNARRAKPWQDLLISLAGPVSSFALAFLAGWLQTIPFVIQDPMLRAFVPLFQAANVFWAIFNLIPVPPLDGGHATREFFRIFLNEQRAFVISVWIALIVGSGVAIFAMATRSYILALYIAWFVYMSWQSWQHFRKYGTPGD